LEPFAPDIAADFLKNTVYPPAEKVVAARFAIAAIRA
jgi:hypothetical protein